MSTQHGIHLTGRLRRHRPATSASAPTTAAATTATTTAATTATTTATTATAVTAREASIAGLRIGVGFVFLWAFLDKTFGLHYTARSKGAWIHGGSPTKGFLSHVSVGPFQSAFHSMAGNGLVDWLFMLGLLGIGAAMVSGVGLRIAAACGVVLLAMMWFAVFPPAQHTATGAASGSSNPFVDEHVLEALALTVAAVFGTGSRLGLGAWWDRLPFVDKHRSLI